jgi:nucleoside-diphosphate-sugar epimerase
MEAAAEKLGFRPEVSLEQGLQELIRWRQSIQAVPEAVVEA